MRQYSWQQVAVFAIAVLSVTVVLITGRVEAAVAALFVQTLLPSVLGTKESK